MDPLNEYVKLQRRQFLATSANGVGALALASLLQQDGLLAAETKQDALVNPLAPKAPHFPAKATNCIFIFLAGAPSQIDLFDPKPKLNELNGQPLPPSMTENVRFAFIQKESARLMGSSRKFTKQGECGMELSDLLPNLGTVADDICLVRSLHTDAFNHHPGQLMMNTGVQMFGRPSVGSWLNYGLGSPSDSLPGYVVLTAGRGTSGGASNWSSGFLPSTYQGVLFRNQGEPVLNLSNPRGLTSAMQRRSLDALNRMNELHKDQMADPEINSRIASYELAFRMQSAAPELIDLSKESKKTLEEYGVDREVDSKRFRGGGPEDFKSFATNCLLARRMVERGVRFVSLYHASWDHHSNLDQGLSFNCKMADQPIAALLKDLKQRGLLDSTLVVFAGEFGRTPLGENRPGFKSVSGRDHHPFAFSVWMAGGGVKGGQVIGKTDEIGWNIEEDPVHINDLHATLLHLFGLRHKELTYRFKGLDIRLTDQHGKVVDKMLA
ncbi:hypothetical protein Pan216_29660 [Planctomycetes bacterium Pan216]|uniref:Sulfatase n=1 Tax=Kolteria novifilia TaxID=2527975 RepID=A0A518B542_9BACT|nr:hypothetical protein Pan216_29660 [Planctomycetes bacterium Pan216]